MITCPFCDENDFDTVGLKSHLLNNCEEFENTESPLQERSRKTEENERGFGRKS